MTDRALLTFSLGPVQSFISQARRVADLWAGSDLLSHLVETAIGELGRQGGSLVFPAAKLDDLPQGLPNRFVAEVPFATAAEVAQAMEKAVRAEWDRLVGQTVGLLAAEPYEFSISPKIWQAQGWDRQTDTLFEIAWSFVPLGDDYAAASRAGAELFAASRQFRPFRPIEERLDKCAVCGERTALPNGVRGDVKSAWQHAAAQPGDDERFFRADQTRLCLVCATKRLTPKFTDRRRAQFYSFQEFEPQPVKAEGQQRHDERFPYFALVALDGDKMGEILGWDTELRPGRAREFHAAISRALAGFADELRGEKSQNLNLAALALRDLPGRHPQLVYAGGDDVILLADLRAALPVARAIRARYLERLRGPEVVAELADADTARRITTSGAILFAHTKHPAGLLFRDLHDLLDRKAKHEAGRDALALRLDKRGGVPVEVALRWDPPADGAPGVDAFEALVARVAAPGLASRQTFLLPEDLAVLTPVLGGDLDRWTKWLAERLSRGEHSAEVAAELAAQLAPFFVHGKTEALRIARFLAREAGEKAGEEAP